jgi:hypothetical protein
MLPCEHINEIEPKREDKYQCKECKVVFTWDQIIKFVVNECRIYSTATTVTKNQTT